MREYGAHHEVRKKAEGSCKLQNGLVKVCLSPEEGHTVGNINGRSTRVSRRKFRLLELRNIYRGLVHSGQALRKRRAIYPKPGEATHQDIKKQTNFL